MNSSENQTKVENEAADSDIPNTGKNQLSKKIQEMIRALFTAMQNSLDKTFSTCRELLNNDSFIQPAIEKCRTAAEQIHLWFVNIQNRLTGRNENAADSISDLAPDGKKVQPSSVSPENRIENPDFMQKTESFYEKVIQAQQKNENLTFTNQSAAGNPLYSAPVRGTAQMNGLYAQGTFSESQNGMLSSEQINKSIDSKMTKVNDLLENIKTLQDEIKTTVNKGLNI